MATTSSSLPGGNLFPLHKSERSPPGPQSSQVHPIAGRLSLPFFGALRASQTPHTQQPGIAEAAASQDRVGAELSPARSVHVLYVRTQASNRSTPTNRFRKPGKSIQQYYIQGISDAPSPLSFQRKRDRTGEYDRTSHPTPPRNPDVRTPTAISDPISDQPPAHIFCTQNPPQTTHVQYTFPPHDMEPSDIPGKT
jgi:hypothetical protein